MNVDQEKLDRENWYVLAAVQALLGLIGPTVEAVALQVADGDEVILRFWTHGNEAEVAEDADDAIADMDGLLNPEHNPYISVEILPGSPQPGVSKWAGRLIYWAKTPLKHGDAEG